MSKKALEGVKVVEYADGIGMSFCGKLFADMGASVIKVERPKTGDDTRGIGPFLRNEPGPENSCVFFYNNTNKMSVTLDLNSKAGQDIMLKLLEKADIFLKTGQPEWYDERGLGWEQLKKMNPGMIVGSLTPYGESGKYKNYKANPLNVSHLSGMATVHPLNSWPDLSRPPVMEGANFEQYDAGAMAAAGVMAALYARNITGKGQYMELSEIEAVFQVSATENTSWPVYGFSQDRLGARLMQMASEEVECLDGYVCPYFVQAHEYERVAKMFGREDWLEEGWLKDYDQRASHLDEFRAEFHKWLSDKTRAQVSEIAQSYKLAVSPVFTLREAMDMEQFKFREFFTDVEHPAWGKVKMVSRPFIMEGTPMAIEKAAPLLGADTAAVLAELGYAQADIDKLAKDNVI